MVADMALASSDLPWPASPDMTTEYMLRTKAGAAINRCVLATTECYPLVSLRSVDSLSVYANESYLIRTQRIFDESCVGEEARPVGFGLLVPHGDLDPLAPEVSREPMQLRVEGRLLDGLRELRGLHRVLDDGVPARQSLPNGEARTQ